MSEMGLDWRVRLQASQAARKGKSNGQELSGQTPCWAVPASAPNFAYLPATRAREQYLSPMVDVQKIARKEAKCSNCGVDRHRKNTCSNPKVVVEVVPSASGGSIT